MATGKRAFDARDAAPRRWRRSSATSREPIAQLDAAGAGAAALDRRALPRQGAGGALRLDARSRPRSGDRARPHLGERQLGGIARAGTTAPVALVDSGGAVRHSSADGRAHQLAARAAGLLLAEPACRGPCRAADRLRRRRTVRRDLAGRKACGLSLRPRWPV